MRFENNPVMVIAADTIIGVTVVRSLGRQGVPTYCAFTASDALGPRSRYCRGSFRLPDTPDEAIAAIQEYSERWKVTHLIGMSERDIGMLNRYRDVLEGRHRLLFPPQHVFETAIRKNLTLKHAAQVGIPIPKTEYPANLQELEERCARFRFPVILKMAHRVPTTAFPHQYVRVQSFEELRNILEGLPSNDYPMVQEYIPGSGIGVSLLMRSGKAVMAFQHRRLREFPPNGGVSVMCEAVPLHPDLLRQAEMLLQSMNWEGVAMVEYRADADTGRYALMEVNGRFWGSLAAAVFAGADFPFWLYRTSFPDSPIPSKDYRVGVQARSLAGDTKWLLAVLRSHDRPAARAIGAYVRAFRPATRYFTWAWDDPRPAISNFVGRFRRTRLS
jgi:predicted ATP-grasp superfamily ATP-dependent carboligase